MRSHAHRGLLLTALAAAISVTTTACATPDQTPAAIITPPATVRLFLPALSDQPPAPVSTPSMTTSTNVDGSASAPPDPDIDVEQLAKDWLVAYRAADYTAPADAWIDRVIPYSTTDLAAQFQALRNGGRGPGLSWQTFLDRGCTARVDDVAAVIPPEAPRSAATLHVQAAAVLRTSCADGTDPPDEALSVTLTAVLTDDGWRIASRDY